MIRMSVCSGSILSLLLTATATLAFAGKGEEPAGKPVVVMKTNLGVIEIELDREKAPITVDNFLKYVDDGFYNGTIFHRVIKGFMVQGGGIDINMKPKETRAQIKNEATNGLKNDVGTIAMARTSVVDSATAQFFINTVDNQALNHRSTDARGYGYAVFGKVTSGMETVYKIENSPTGARDVPVEQIVIESVTRK